MYNLNEKGMPFLRQLGHVTRCKAKVNLKCMWAQSNIAITSGWISKLHYGWKANGNNKLVESEFLYYS